jgi:precorrin-4/cobalt-precorrin-4 C11-methyltransferase
VLHLAIRRTRELAAQLSEHYGADCPVVVVAEAEQPGQMILRGTLADIGEQVEAAELRQAAVVLVGWALAAEHFAESHLYGSRVRRPAG